MVACDTCKYAGRPCYKSPCSECKGYSKHEYEKPQTNADRIRAMSDEELAALLSENTFRPDDYLPIEVVCKIRLAWLRQPADTKEE